MTCSRSNPSINTLVQYMQANLNKQIIEEFNMKMIFLLVINLSILKLSWIVKSYQYFCINYCWPEELFMHLLKSILFVLEVREPS